MMRMIERRGQKRRPTSSNLDAANELLHDGGALDANAVLEVIGVRVVFPKQPRSRREGLVIRLNFLQESIVRLGTRVYHHVC